MRRGIKLGLYGLVLAGLLGGTAAWVSGGKSVDLRIDGQDRRVHTSASDVEGVLASAHVKVGEHDLVAPDLQSPVRNGGQIVISRGHLLHLTVNGQPRDVWVNADSVAEALSQLGYSTARPGFGVAIQAAGRRRDQPGDQLAEAADLHSWPARPSGAQRRPDRATRRSVDGGICAGSRRPAVRAGHQRDHQQRGDPDPAGQLRHQRAAGERPVRRGQAGRPEQLRRAPTRWSRPARTASAGSPTSWSTWTASWPARCRSARPC